MKDTFYGLVIVLLGLFLGFSVSKNISLSHETSRLGDVANKDSIYHKEIRHIESVLLTAYKLSVYEARYYSYMLYDLSREFPIDSNWCLIASTAYVENKWHTIGVSRDGAKGLMQFLPGTADQYSDTLSIVYRKDTTEYNVILSMALGAKYLSIGYDKGISNAIRTYVGGGGHSRAKDQSYIIKYEKDIMHEYRKLCLIEKQLRLEIK